MMPRRIANATHSLGAPKGWDAETQGNCVRLWVRAADDGVFESAWEPTPDEIAAINAGASVVLRVVGGQPPVALYVESPSATRCQGLAGEI